MNSSHGFSGKTHYSRRKLEIICLKKYRIWAAGGVAQQLRSLGATDVLPEDSGPIPSNHTVSLNPWQLHSLGIYFYLPLSFTGTRHACGANAYM